MGKKFVISDLDGTLLDNPKRLSEQYVNQLNDLIANGLDFTIATGRDLKKTKKAVRGLKLKYPVILTNGALLADLNEEKYLETTSIEPDIVDDVLEMGHQREISPIVFASFDAQNDKMHFNKGKWGKKYNPPLLLEKNDYVPFQNNLVVSIQFHATKNILDPMREEIYSKYKGQINLIYIEDVSYKHHGIDGEWYWLEINSKIAGKANMLKVLAEKVQRDLRDIVVFGDNYNDMGILEIAGKAIVVKDAPEEVKKLADDICPPSDKGGVIQYLLEHKQELI